MGKFTKKKTVDVPKEKKILKKNVSINVEKMSKREYSMYSNSSEIIVKNFSIKISGGSARINKKTYHSKNNEFNFQLKNEFSKLKLECLQSMDPVDSPKPKAITKKMKCQQVKSLTVLIRENWAECKRRHKTTHSTLKEDDLIMAKMATYSPWPAKIISFSSNGKRALVYFYGTDNEGTVNVCEITPFVESESVIRLLLLRKINPFHKGIAQIERYMNIPPELSLLKELNAIEN